MKLYDTRQQMINALVPKNGVYPEIGVLAGEFAKQIYSILSPEKLILIDLFTGNCGSGDQDGNNYQEYNLDDEYIKLINFTNIFPSITSTIEVIKGDSSTILSTYNSNTFDMVYIDGDHSYEGCKKDLEASYNIIKKNGWIMGHDYEMNMNKTNNTYNFGIKKAVDEFCIKYNQTIYAKALDGCVSFAICISKD
jgi:hypothetical protein